MTDCRRLLASLAVALILVQNGEASERGNADSRVSAGRSAGQRQSLALDSPRVFCHTPSDRPNFCYFNEFTDNVLRYCVRPGKGVGDQAIRYGLPDNIPSESLCIGNIFRGNDIEGSDTGLVVGHRRNDRSQKGMTLIRDALLEDNELRNCETGVRISNRAAGTMLRANEFENVEVELENQGRNTTRK